MTTKLSEVQKTIMDQMNAMTPLVSFHTYFGYREILIDGDNTVIYKKGKRTIKITYDYESDLYNVHKGHLTNAYDYITDVEELGVQTEDIFAVLGLDKYL